MSKKYYDRWKCCKRKIAHLTRKEAYLHAQKLGGKYKVYSCPYDDHFHVGRPSRRHIKFSTKHKTRSVRPSNHIRHHRAA